ncbi:MAG TPA: hypothetical protein VML55_27030 [Planctomycetaceae bacterium]|nr:hypothetical protein [Planctomycetaceae bacterium]
MSEQKAYVYTDEHGTMRVGELAVMLRAESVAQPSPVVERLRALKAAKALERS